jgi:cytochrome c oxidase subunit III
MATRRRSRLSEAVLTPRTHAPASTRLQHHFDTMAQQKEAVTLGMWVFLVTELMFFGGMFAAYLLYRMWYYDGYVAASRELDLVLGGINTVVLIGSSLTVALGVHAAQTGKKAQVVNYLIVTGLLGLVFLVIKYFEYSSKFDLHAAHHGASMIRLFPGAGIFEVTGDYAPIASQIRMFMVLYFALTGMHALHMIIGIGILAVITRMAIKGEFTPQWYSPVEIFGLYWHFVDIVWIFLFPLLYLVNRHG